MASATDGTGGERKAGAVQGTASFGKFMTVLQAIADRPGGLDMAGLAGALSYPRGTLYRIVQALVAEGLVTETRRTGTFELGPRLIQLASMSWEGSDLRQAARDHIEVLRDATGETVHLAVPSGAAMVYIDKLESPRAVRMMSRIGTRVELHSTSVGKAYLAALPPERCSALMAELSFEPRTPATITDAAGLQAEIAATRERGYSLDDQENEPDIRCVGAAIVDRTGEPIGCISLSMPIYRYDDAVAAGYVDRVVAAARAVSQALSAVV